MTFRQGCQRKIGVLPWSIKFRWWGLGFGVSSPWLVWSNKQHGYPATWYGSRSSWDFCGLDVFFSCLPSFQIQVVIVASKNTSNSGLAKGMKEWNWLMWYVTDISTDAGLIFSALRPEVKQEIKQENQAPAEWQRSAGYLKVWKKLQWCSVFIET